MQHQRNWKQSSSGSDTWYDRGAKTFQATKWRKGSCENCGSASHATKDCLERPRSKGAKWTGKNIAADDKIQDIHLASWDTKRDRWNGFDTKDYSKVVERYDKLEEIRMDMKQKEQVDSLYGKKEAEEGVREGEEGGSGQQDDAKIAEDEAAGFAKLEKRVNTTAGGSTGSVRNLRIREDTAKYLLNLDLESAHYDPKSRSMREDPQPNKPLNEKTFVGDNFVRSGGDFAAWQSMQVHSMEAFDKGQDVHMIANPSLAEMLYKQFKEKKEVLAKQSSKDVLSKYGSAAEKMPEDVAQLGATERYVEYDRTGRVVKGVEVKVRSLRYEEDVLVNNHTCVWGSWWKDGSWGYKCCHSFVKNSYCTGGAGLQATTASAGLAVANMQALAASSAEVEEDRRKKKEESKLNSYKGWGADDQWGSETAKPDEIDEDKVRAALVRLEEKERAAVEGEGSKRKFNSLDAGAEMTTPEEMEAWRLKKLRPDDPMAKIVESEMKGQGAQASGYEFL